MTERKTIQTVKELFWRMTCVCTKSCVYIVCVCVCVQIAVSIVVYNYVRQSVKSDEVKWCVY